jgi:ribosomal protein S27AE
MGNSPGENASLDDFSDESVDNSADEDAERDQSTARCGPAFPDETGATTARVTPAGRPCENCGTTATHLWDTDGRLVCGDCKEWA